MRSKPVVPLHLLVSPEGPLIFKVNANLRPKDPSTGMVCKHCGVRDDAFGCYDTCTFNGPLHEWIEPASNNSSRGARDRRR